MGALDHAVTLAGRLVRLRPISRDDYPALFGWRSSLETVHMLNFRRRVGPYEEFVRELEGVLAGGMLLLVEEEKGGRPIGYVLAHNINPWDGWPAWSDGIVAYIQVPRGGGPAGVPFFGGDICNRGFC